MKTIKFLDKYGNEFFSCTPSEARASIKLIKENRQRKLADVTVVTPQKINIIERPMPDGTASIIYDDFIIDSVLLGSPQYVLQGENGSIEVLGEAQRRTFAPVVEICIDSADLGPGERLEEKLKYEIFSLVKKMQNVGATVVLIWTRVEPTVLPTSCYSQFALVGW